MKTTNLEVARLAYLQAKKDFNSRCKKSKTVYGDAYRDLLNALESEGLYDPMLDDDEDDDLLYDHERLAIERQKDILDYYTRDDEEDECWDDEDTVAILTEDGLYLLPDDSYAPPLSLVPLGYEKPESVKNRQVAVVV